jgi:hypothetical protein
VNAMFERSRQAGERTQIQDPEEANFTVLNVPYRLLSGSEPSNPHSAPQICIVFITLADVALLTQGLKII